jgi:hypothetical protein
MSVQLHTQSNLPLGKDLPVPIKQKGGLGPKDKFEKRRSLSLLGIEYNSSELQVVDWAPQ